MRVAVLGDIASGKNSMVNALSGEKVLPVSFMSKPFNWYLRSSTNDFARVFFRDGRHEKWEGEYLNENIQNISKLKVRGVQSIYLHKNLPALKYLEIEIYNCDFLHSSVNFSNEKMMEELSDCEYIIYVIDCVNPFPTSVMRDLELLHTNGFEQIIFVFNKCDLLKKPSDSRKTDFINKVCKFTRFGEEAMFFLSSLDGLKAQQQKDRELYIKSGYEALGRYLTARYLDLENNEQRGASIVQDNPTEHTQTEKTQKNDGAYQTLTQNENYNEHYDIAQTQDDEVFEPFWLSVEDVCYFPDTGLAVSGDVVDGRVECLDKVEIVGLSGKKTTTVKKIACDGSLRSSVSEFDEAVLLFEDIGENEVKRGDVICTPGTAVVGRKFQARMDDGYEDAFKTALFEEEPLKFHFGLDDIQGKRYNYISGGLYEIELSEPVVLREGFEFCVVKADGPFAWGTVQKIDAVSFEERMVNETSSNKNNINTYRGSEDVQWEDVCKMPDEEMRGYIDNDIEAAGITDYVYSEDIDPCIVRDFLECFDINIPLKEEYVFCRLDWDASDPHDVYGYLLTDTALYWRYSDNLFRISLPTIRRSYVSYSVEEGIRYTEFIIETVFEDFYLLWKIEEGENLSVRRKQFDILQEYVDFYGR